MLKYLPKTIALSALALLRVQGKALGDKVKADPDQADWGDVYSGYLPVSPTKALHYMFAESMSDSGPSDPVLLWFNGGPGCSSLEGFFVENGPVIVDSKTGTVGTNPFPWNKRANVIYLESPAGVGYSIAMTDQDTNHNDYSQSVDAFAALEAFFERFPEYLDNNLFISGESYAGVYVPYLSWQIYQNNQKAKFSKHKKTYNLVGQMVGNGVTNWDYDTDPAVTDTVYGFNMIPKNLYDEMETNGCLFYGDEVKPPLGPESCKDTWAKIQELISYLDFYDLYLPKSEEAGKMMTDEERMGRTMVDGIEKTYKRGRTKAEYTRWARKTPGNLKVEDAFLSDYINDPKTRKAMNIPTFVQGWEVCSDTVGQNYHIQVEGSYWIYPILKAAGIKMMHYSGDRDGAVPTYGTRGWVQSLNWERKQEWHPWTTLGQVSGFFERYDGLDFVTVKGVGHMSPQYARQDVQSMITAWIHNEDFGPF